MTDRRVTSDEYVELATLLAHKIVELLSSSKQRNMAPPLELHVTGADDEMVLHCWCQQESKSEIQFLGPPDMTKLRARFPLTATVTDANGESLEMTISPKYTPCSELWCSKECRRRSSWPCSTRRRGKAHDRHCQKIIASATVENIPIRSGVQLSYHGVSYLCPHCRAVLSVSFDPFSMNADGVSRLQKALRKG
jgi:hypothetical protein